MKHNLKINLLLVLIFLLAQFTGLYVVNHYINHKATAETKVVQWEPLPYEFERPEVKNQLTSFIWVVAAVIIGTLLFLLLIKLNKPTVWKVWFSFTVWITLLFSFSAFVSSTIAAFLALAFALVRIFKPNVIAHNISEIFIYGGLAAIFVPILNIFAVSMLLILISVYDMIAVWKTKHMVHLAEFQAKTKSFAGLFISYKSKSKSALKLDSDVKGKNKKYHTKKLQPSAAILGGGDIGFPLIFAGAVMKTLMLKETVLRGFLITSIIPVCTAIALFILLYKGENNKFYPAMPFLSAGCFIGFGIIFLLGVL